MSVVYMYWIAYHYKQLSLYMLYLDTMIKKKLPQ